MSDRTSDPNRVEDNRLIIKTSQELVPKEEDVNQNSTQMNIDSNDSNLNSDNSSNFVSFN